MSEDIEVKEAAVLHLKLANSALPVHRGGEAMIGVGYALLEIAGAIRELASAYRTHGPRGTGGGSRFLE